MAGLTRENVASHLQKHRMRLKKEEDEAGGNHAPAASGRGDAGDRKRAAAAAEAEAPRVQRPRRAAAAGAAAAAAAAAAIVPELSQVSGKLQGRAVDVGRALAWHCSLPSACATQRMQHPFVTTFVACAVAPADGRTAEGGA